MIIFGWCDADVMMNVKKLTMHVKYSIMKFAKGIPGKYTIGWFQSLFL